MSFEKLVAEITVLTKALPAVTDGGDAAAAAADAAAAAAAEAAAGTEGGEGGKGGEGGVEALAKSFSFTLEDGTTVEATDGTELVKSLMTRVQATDTTLAKSLTEIQGVMAAQNGLLKSLAERVTQLSGQGRGRKAVVSVTERPAAGETELAKSERDGMSGQEFLAKAEGAFKAKKISGNELSMCETLLNKGMQIPAPLAAKVLG